MKGFKSLALAVVVLTLVAAGCKKKEEEETRMMSPHETGEIPLDQLEQHYGMPGPSEVVIPDDIKASWSAIKIELTDNESGKKELVTIGIGEEAAIEGTGLKVKVLSFLPAFQMDGPVITSRSNETENPAAQIEVYEDGSQVFKGWLFALYPTTHAFTHPKYSITLVEGIAAEKS